MKRIKTLISLCFSSVLLVSCANYYSTTQSNTNGDNSGSSSGVIETDELTKIQENYNDLDWTYSGEPVTISLTHWDSAGRNVESAVLNAMLKGFNNRYPTITVELEIVGDYENNYGNNIAAGNVSDVFLVPDGAFASWASSKKMENLTPYINSSSVLVNYDDIFSTAITRYQYDFSTNLPGKGTQLALPKDIGPYVMYYNKDVFEMMGVELPPTDRIMTIDEATTMWQSLTQYDSSGSITRYGVGGLCIEGLVWSAGGDFLNEDRSAFPTDATTLAGLKKGYQYMQDSYFKYNVQPPYEFTAGQDAATLFSSQRVATFIGGRYNVTSFRNLDFDWDIAYVPAFEENQTKNMYSGSVGYAMYSGCQNKEAAWKLIEYIASEEGQEILSSTGFQIPVYETLANSDRVVARETASGQKPQNYSVFVNSARDQSYGLWQYRNNQKWKTMGYDTTSERLYDNDPSRRWTVDQFLSEAKEAVEQNLY